MARAAGQPALTPPRPIEDLIDHLSEVTDGPVDPEEVRRALTHRSFAYEAGGVPHNERLEFLGDAVLGVIVTQTLYHRHPDLPEGQLAKLRSAVVNMRALAEVGRTLGLGDYLFLGRGEESTGGRDKDSILADAVEAVIGAVHVSRGISGADALVHHLLDPVMAAASHLGAGLDWKTSLQELAAAQGAGAPSYAVHEEGPEHAKTFTAEVLIDGAVEGSGEGRTKKDAEQRAAARAWESLSARSSAQG
ncbi:MAG: ribonuclease III [Actinobacteria bacterium]|jgi:ribonuclease-3|nr:ribonuclease III [Actinomycetota bacterium]